MQPTGWDKTHVFTATLKGVKHMQSPCGPEEADQSIEDQTEDQNILSTEVCLSYAMSSECT